MSVDGLRIWVLGALTLGLSFITGGTIADDRRQVPDSSGLVTLSYAPVVKKVVPAVVNIYARRTVREQASPFANDPFFSQFFNAIPRERVQNSLGSGVILRSEGVIVTNNHVINGAEEITVALSDRREFHAQVILADQRTDLAVLRIDPKGEKLPFVPLRNSDEVEVGDLVLAIGNPFGVGQTVTSGIVSALARTQVGVSDYQFFIQTDAAINPGNSGGALVTTDGSLIGINSAIFSQSGGSVGIGFAIPANMVRLVVQAALSGGTVSRPWLGARGQPVTADLASGLGLDRPGGVLLNQVSPDGPAARAGLAVGDVITAIDGFDVSDPQALFYRIATRALGSTARIDYHRNGKALVANLVMAKAPENVPRDLTPIKGQNPFSGATLGNLSPAFAEELGIEDATSGVVVVEIDPTGIAAQLVRLRPGDILVSIDGQEVNRAADAKKMLAARRPQWRLVIKRHDQLLNVIVPG
jgi:serine protease Do